MGASTSWNTHGLSKSLVGLLFLFPSAYMLYSTDRRVIFPTASHSIRYCCSNFPSTVRVV